MAQPTARVKAAQEAEADRLAKQQAEFEAKMKEHEEAARKAAEAEAEKRRQEEAAIQAEREKLEQEKAAAAHAAIVAERESVWDIAHIDNFNFDHAAALVDHEEFKAGLQAEMAMARADAMAMWEQTEQAKTDAAERLKLIGPDKLMITTIANSFDEWVSSRVEPCFSAEESMLAYCDLISRFKSAIHCFEQAGKELK